MLFQMTVLAICCAALFSFLLVYNVRYFNKEYKKINQSRRILGKQHRTHAIDAGWQQVLHTSYDVWVFSAFYDNRTIETKHFEGSRAIRITGRSIWAKEFEKPLGLTNEVVCRFWYDEEDFSNSAKNEDMVEGNIEFSKENFGGFFSAIFLHCPLKEDKTIPTSVSIFAYDEVIYLKGTEPLLLPPAHNRLVVNNRLEIKEPTAAMAICVPPLFNGFSRDWEIIEWIELNKLMGFPHFYFYDQSLSNEVTCILKDYVSKGDATVIRWDGRRPNNEGRIRQNTMYVMYNDCLYRYMYQYKYLAFFDVDEFLVPKKHKNLIELMADMEKRETSMASVSFRNVFFYKEWPDDPNANGSKIISMKKTRRTVSVHADGTRSKFICKPFEVVEPGNHVLLEARTSQKKTITTVTLDLDTGFSHHYRSICEVADCLKLESQVDTSMWRWKSTLTAAMDKQKTAQLCKLNPQ